VDGGGLEQLLFHMGSDRHSHGGGRCLQTLRRSNLQILMGYEVCKKRKEEKNRVATMQNVRSEEGSVKKRLSGCGRARMTACLGWVGR